MLIATLTLATVLAIFIVRKYLLSDTSNRNSPRRVDRAGAHAGDSARPGSNQPASDKTPLVPSMKFESHDDAVDRSSEQQGGDITPKARPSQPSNTSAPQVPTLQLDNITNLDTDRSVAPAPVPLPSAKPQLDPRKSAGLMPPPRAPARSALPPSASSGLRAPSSGPLPNRDPSGLQRPSTGLAPSANTAGKRNKVLLKPGHSPLDWATLTRSSTNLAGVPGLQRVTPSMLKFHHGRKGRPAWSSYNGKVYNITPYLPFHPGGEGELMRAAGKDGEKLFMEYHPWVNWDNMLNSCLVGIMVSEGAEGAGLDDLD